MLSSRQKSENPTDNNQLTQLKDVYNEKAVGISYATIQQSLDEINILIKQHEALINNIDVELKACVEKIENIKNMSKGKENEYDVKALNECIAGLIKKSEIEETLNQENIDKIVNAENARISSLKQEIENIRQGLINHCKIYAKWAEKLAHFKRFLAEHLIRAVQEYFNNLNGLKKFKNEIDQAQFVETKRQELNKKFLAFGIQVNEQVQVKAELVYDLFENKNLKEIEQMIADTLTKCSTFFGPSEEFKMLQQTLNLFAEECADECAGKFTEDVDATKLIKTLLTTPFKMNETHFLWSKNALTFETYVNTKCKIALQTNKDLDSSLRTLQDIKKGKQVFENDPVNNLANNVSPEKKSQYLVKIASIKQKATEKNKDISTLQNNLASASQELDGIQKQCLEKANSLAEIKKRTDDSAALHAAVIDAQNKPLKSQPINIVIVENNPQPIGAEEDAVKLCKLIKEILEKNLDFWNKQLNWRGGEEYHYKDIENNEQTIKLPKGIHAMLTTIGRYNNLNQSKELLTALQKDAEECISRPEWNFRNFSNFIKYNIFGIRTAKTTQVFYEIIKSFNNNYQKITGELTKNFSKSMKEEKSDFGLKR